MLGGTDSIAMLMRKRKNIKSYSTEIKCKLGISLKMSREHIFEMWAEPTFQKAKRWQGDYIDCFKIRLPIENTAGTSTCEIKVTQ